MGEHDQESFWNSKSLLLGRRHLFQLQSLMLLVALIVVLPGSAISQTCLPNGDINQDGNITASDALLAFQHALGIADPPLNSCQLTLADVYPIPTAPDGRITASDALCIFQKALSLVSCLDVMAGQPIAEPISFQVDPAVPYVEYQLMGTDPDGDTLTYELLDEPSGVGYTNAAVDPQSGILYATITAGFSGEIRLHYRVTDGRLFSAPAIILIIVEILTDDQGLGSLPIPPEEYADLLSADASRFGESLFGEPLPLSIDLSANFPIPGNQGCLGSCVGWATAYALKSYQEKLEVGWALNTSSHLFSPAFIYNQINGGRDGGSRIDHALDLIINQGAATLAIMPYREGRWDATIRQCVGGDYLTQPSAEARREAAKFKGAEKRRINSVRDLKGYLVEGMPVVIGMTTCDAFRKLQGSNAVYNSFGGHDCGGHAVTIVGYNDNRFGGAFRVINSWGTGWGDGGYFWLPYSFFPYAVGTSFILADAENPAPVVPPVIPPPRDDLPNLQVRNWNVTYDPRPRGRGQLQYSVANTGTGIAPSGADVNFMLSENRRISSTDYFVVWETISFDLRPGRAATRDQDNQLDFSFPDNLPEGTYYMAVWVDDFDVVEESNEDDNVSLGEGRVTIENTLPDLYVRKWYAEWDYYSGNGTLTYEVENIGRSSVHHGDWDINLVLSPDETIGGEDGYNNEIFLFYEASTYALNPGANVYRDDSSPAYFNIYQDAFGYSVPSGVYYMAVWVDDLEVIEESNELNNYSLGGNLIDISYASSPVAAADGDRAHSPVLGGADGASALVQQSPFVQPTRQVLNRLYNGHELPTHDALVKKVRIERTPQGGMSLTVVEDVTTSDTSPSLLSEDGDEELPAHTQQRRSADTVIFPVVEEFFMPQNNPPNQGGK